MNNQSPVLPFLHVKPTPSKLKAPTFSLAGHQHGFTVLEDLHLDHGVVHNLEEKMELRNSLVMVEPRQRLLNAQKLGLKH